MVHPFDILILGGGASGMSCALVLGSAKDKVFAKDKKIGIVIHQKSSHLRLAMFNNVLGLDSNTKGTDILKKGKNQLASLYDHVIQIDDEKVTEVERVDELFSIRTNKFTYQTKEIVVALGYTNLFHIKGLQQYIEPHQKAKPEKQRIQLKNIDHLVDNGIYVSGTLAGWRSQFAIACGSGASVATDILTKWNGGVHTKIHDKASPNPDSYRDFPKERGF